jgi:hypothetical protein
MLKISIKIKTTSKKTGSVATNEKLRLTGTSSSPASTKRLLGSHERFTYLAKNATIRP